MDKLDNMISLQVPPRVKVAYAYLLHTRTITWTPDVSVPVRELTPLEQSVQTVALRALQQYLLGEMDFAEQPATPPETPIAHEKRIQERAAAD
jgi:hypothetical protein